MNNLKPNSSRAKTAISLISVVMVLDVIAFISHGMQYNLLCALEDGKDVLSSEIDSNDKRESFIGILYMLFYIISAITFIQWFRRAYYNLHQRVDNCIYSEGWAAGSWFVPIIGLWWPFQIMRELYQETALYLSSKGVELKEELSTKWLGVWWTFWILNNVLGQIAFRLADDADTLGELKGFTMLGWVGDVVGVVLALITIKVIKDYAIAENEFYKFKEAVEPSIES